MSPSAGDPPKPNILVLCIDQWQTRTELPQKVELPSLRRLDERGVSFDRHYCTSPMCTPSRATMWTGVHAKQTGLWDNTNFAWIDGLSNSIPTIGQMLDKPNRRIRRELGEDDRPFDLDCFGRRKTVSGE